MHSTNIRHQYHLHWQKIGFLFVACLLCLQANTQAQTYKYKRIHDEFYDEKPVHFGFLFGLGTSRFIVDHSKTFNAAGNRVVTVVSPTTFAFQVGGIANFVLSKHFDFKTGVNVALYGRQVDYRLDPALTLPEYAPEIRESTWLEIPLLIKFKSQRRENSRMYLDAGFKVGLEASVRKNSSTNILLTTKSSDLSLEYGIGFEQFFKYFKFTPELRFSHGLTNMFLKTGASQSPYRSNIETLNSHTVTLLVMFE